MKLLVTGAGGMLGRNFVEHPGAAAHELLTPARGELDLRDRAAVIRYLEAQRPDGIIHLAGIVGGVQSRLEQPLRYLVEGCQLTLNLVEAALAARVGMLFNMGSAAMYPPGLSARLRPADVMTAMLHPSNEAYGLAKIVGCRTTAYVRRQHPELRYHSFIPCNLFGRYDHFDDGRSQIVPSIIHKLVQAKAEGQPEVEIWGDGSTRREIMYAADFVDFLLFALDKVQSLPDVMNVGVGTDHSVGELYARSARIAGYEGSFRYNIDRPAGSNSPPLDLEAQRALGWSAPTPLDQALRETFAFYRAGLERNA